MDSITAKIGQEPLGNQFQRDPHGGAKPEIVAQVDTAHLNKEHTKAYLDEFSNRINSSIHKENIFDGLIRRMIGHPPVNYKNLKLCS